MTLTVGLQITGNASGGAAAVRSVKDEMTALKGSAAQLTAELARNRAEMTQMTVAGQRTGAASDGLREKQARLNAALAQNKASHAALAASLTGAGAASGAAAAQAGVLAAQFNDVFTVIASGQAPLQAGIQQGMQIGQVFQTSGFQVGMLKQAMIGMSAAAIPIAVIIGVGMLAQSLMGAREEAVTAREAIENLEGSVDDFTKAAEQAARPTAELIEKFGTMSTAAETIFDIMARSQRMSALDDMIESAEKLDTKLAGIAPILAELQTAQSARGGTGAGSVIDLTTKLREEYGLTVEAARALVPLIEELSGVLTSGVPARIADAGKALTVAFDQAAQSGGRAGAQLSVIIDMMGSLTLSTLQYRATDMTKPGADAIPVMTRLGLLLTNLKAGAELVGDTDMSGGLRGAIANAGALIERLFTAAELARSLSAMSAANLAAASTNSGGRGDGMAEWNSRRGIAPPSGGETFAEWVRDNPLKSPASGGGSGGGPGGGAGSAMAEANATAALIDKLQGEIAALQTLDPIKREMLQNREALSTATEAERLKVESLIATREREEAAAAGLAARVDLMNQLTADGLSGLIVQGKTIGDVWRSTASAIAEAAIQAAIFGKGPFGNMFGGESLWGAILGGGEGWADPGFWAAGGRIEGPGTDTSDNLLARVSPGEFIVNAAATRRHGQMLQAINAGVPGFAMGGLVGRSAPSSGGSAGGGMALTINVNVTGARGDRDIEESTRRGVDQALRAAFEDYDRTQLPQSVRRIQADPRRIG